MESLYISLKTFDELAELQDNVLTSRLRKIKQLIDLDQSYRRDLSTHDLEVELCYAERELEIRTLRQELHEAFTRR